MILKLFQLLSRVLVMNVGEKPAGESPEEVMENREVREAYLGTEAVPC
jgi:ABC-type branched-subunit amino acid transport system ATPase component